MLDILRDNYGNLFVISIRKIIIFENNFMISRCLIKLVLMRPLVLI